MKTKKNIVLVSHILAPYQYEVIKELDDEYINIIFYGPSHLRKNIDPFFKFFCYEEENKILFLLKSFKKKIKIFIHSFSNNIYSFNYPYQLYSSLENSKLLINYHSDSCGDNYFFNWENGWQKINFALIGICIIKN